jgi:hypothetical protein
MGNFVGFNLEGGCHHMALESYKNSIAVAAHAVPYVSGFLAVEPAVGFISTAKLVIGPSQKCPITTDRMRRLLFLTDQVAESFVCTASRSAGARSST